VDTWHLCFTNFEFQNIVVVEALLERVFFLGIGTVSDIPFFLCKTQQFWLAKWRMERGDDVV
jgi:ribosome modulation factor